ncbi:unnamed protein product [Arabidopsis thaliana]|nr:unnamed protein product [Arabidopsis thaliana]
MVLFLCLMSRTKPPTVDPIFTRDECSTAKSLVISVQYPRLHDPPLSPKGTLGLQLVDFFGVGPLNQLQRHSSIPLDRGHQLDHEVPVLLWLNNHENPVYGAPQVENRSVF